MRTQNKTGHGICHIYTTPGYKYPEEIQSCTPALFYCGGCSSPLQLPVQLEFCRNLSPFIPSRIRLGLTKTIDKLNVFSSLNNTNRFVVNVDKLNTFPRSDAVLSHF